MLNKSQVLRREKSGSRSPRKVSPLQSHRSQKSPQKSSKIISAKILKIIQERNETCQRIQSMHQKGNPQKCLEHDVYYSCYCRECREIVCVNCVYGNSKHRAHKVLPIKNAESDIILNNQNLRNKLTKTVQQLKGTALVCEQNSSVLGFNLKRALEDLAQTFQTIYIALRQRQIQLQKVITNHYSLKKNHFVNVKANVNVLLQFIDSHLSRIGHRVLPDQLIYKNKLFIGLTSDLGLEGQIISEGKLDRPILHEVQIKGIIGKIRGIGLVEKLFQTMIKRGSQFSEFLHQ